MLTVKTIIRQIEFARSIPLVQISRRLYLSVKRRLLDATVTAKPLAPLRGPTPRRLPTSGIHASQGRLVRTTWGWTAHFLGVTRDMHGPVNWAQSCDDPKCQLWRMNLHYFEYLPEQTDADSIDLIRNWIARCRPYDPISSSAAWTPYAISVRISCWLCFWSRRGPVGSERFQDLFSTSLREQTRYLASNLETDLRGNHLIKNIRALTEMGAAFQDDEADSWRRLANQWLAKELDHQVMPDGVHFERSPSYHAQVLADFLSIASVRRRDELSVRLDKAVDLMAQAIVDLTHPDGLVAQFNDAGLSMGALPAPCLAGFETVRDKMAPSPRKHFALSDAGFYGFREGGDYLVFDMGKLGPDALMAHAHGDYGSFEWSMNGQRVIVDQGVFEYVEGHKRCAARASKSHNTLVANDVEQADFFGAFRCGRRPWPGPAHYTPTPHGFALIGSITPMGSNTTQILRRHVTYSDRVLQIDDQLKSRRTKNTLTSRLLLHPTTIAEVTSTCVLLRAPNSVQMVVSVAGDARLELEPAEWWPDLGVSIPTTRIVAISDKDLSLTCRPVDH